MTDVENPAPKPTDGAASEAGATGELKRLRWRIVAAAVVAGGLALGGGVHAVRAQRDVAAFVPLAPTAVTALAPSEAVAVKGIVAEIYGNHFILQDPSGRALVDTGPTGDDGALVTKGETIQAQGRFDQGALHARMLMHADGRQVVLGPPGPPPEAPVDTAALTDRVRAAGYQDVRVAGRGPRHVDVVARSADGKDHALHVDVDGTIREQDVF